jgi:hypothetical protein
MAQCFYFTVAERETAAMEASKFPIGYMGNLEVKEADSLQSTADSDRLPVPSDR